VPRWNKSINVVGDYNAKNANSVKAISTFKVATASLIFMTGMLLMECLMMCYAWPSPFCPVLCQLLAEAHSSLWVHGLQ
jgi:hypothetical protein